MYREFNGMKPKVHKDAYVDESAVLIGEVEVEEGASVWPCAVLRGDMGLIRVGRDSSIQDNAACHATRGQSSVIIGQSVSVGHGAVLHGCTVGDNCIIGMNSVVMDGAEIGEWSIVAAGAVVTQNKKFPPRSIIAGIPAKVVKDADENSLEYIRWNGEEYKDVLRLYRAGKQA